MSEEIIQCRGVNRTERDKNRVSVMSRKKAKKKQLDSQTLDLEVQEFVKTKGYSQEFLINNAEVFKAELLQYLQDKNYDVDDIGMQICDLATNQNIVESPMMLPKRIGKISEQLNNYDWGFELFNDTTKICPGTVVYVVEDIAPTPKKPYVTYRPSERVIVCVHSNGVDQGTTFLTRSHRKENNLSYANNGENSFTVVSDEEVIYSPLTKAHAEYICKLLNVQSRQFYKSQLLLAAKQKQK